MKVFEILGEDGKIVKGVNTTVDVQPGETERQAAKFFGHGMPKELHKKARLNSDPNTLYNLGLAESLEEAVKQSHIIKVIDNLASRRDNEPFPVKFPDGVTLGVRPSTARRILYYQDDTSEQMMKKIMQHIHTIKGFKELVQTAGIKENQNFNEDPATMPPLVDLIVMAVLAKTTVDILKGAFVTAYKTGKGLGKLKKLLNKAKQLGQSTANKLTTEDKKDSLIAAALEAMNRLAKEKGSRHSLSNYAFSISRAFQLPISIKELEKLYHETY